MDNLRTTQQTADALGITAGRVRQMALQFNIGTKFGRDRVFTQEEINMLRDRKTTPGPTKGGMTTARSAELAHQAQCYVDTITDGPEMNDAELTEELNRFFTGGDAGISPRFPFIAEDFPEDFRRMVRFIYRESCKGRVYDLTGIIMMNYKIRNEET